MKRKRNITRITFPAQLWLLFGGTLFSSTGIALVWPFLTIYLREQLDVPLTHITLMFTFQSITAFAVTTLVSPLMDRMGRKSPMVLALIGSCLTMIAMSRALTLWQWALLLPLYTAENTIFRIGNYAMVADLVPSDHRSRAYALLRMGDNAGIALGPALGGFLVTVSYALSFYLAAAVQIIIAALILRMVAETLPEDDVTTPKTNPTGYAPLLRDRAFVTTWGLYILVQVANAMIFVLLGVYVKENYGIPENHYGFIVGTNATLVVLLQYSMTRITDRYPPLSVITLGALFYAAGMGIFGVSQGFFAFLLGMIVVTGGELLLIPTATALIANIAPPDMRARYMGTFSLSFRIGAGIGPMMGGVMSDQIAPAAIWYGGMISCLMAALGFWLAHDVIMHRYRDAYAVAAAEA